MTIHPEDRDPGDPADGELHDERPTHAETTDEPAPGFPAPGAQAGPRARTVGEARTTFMTHVAHMIDYWAGGEDSNVPATYNARTRIEGFAHSMLCLLDGCVGDLPGWAVVPQPHPDDKAYHEGRGENYWPPQTPNPMDVAGALHEILYATITELGLPQGESV